jgi:uncharacterized membrane protein
MPHPQQEPNLTKADLKLGLERIVFFSDAVMAIALTLLVIDLKLPDIPAQLAAVELPLRLSELSPRIVSFVISFAVISIYWSSHHRYFTYIKRYDGRLIALNLVFLFFVVLMPFAAGFQGQYGFLPVGTLVYGGAVAATGLSIGALWWYASHAHRLVDHALSPEFIRRRNRVALIVPALFLVSLPFAFWSPLITQAIWWVGPIIAVLVSGRTRQVRRPTGHGPMPSDRGT